ncbi:hypothetical protein, partial [Microcoleus sp. POL10_C6]|uniref:hypothetical protein n=1 Tax=Microcoleus sp. POL10_C6 TaxID=2818852 RepID=UPI002FCFA651
MVTDQPIPTSRVPPHEVDEDTDDGQDATVERSGNRLVESMRGIIPGTSQLDLGVRLSPHPA